MVMKKIKCAIYTRKSTEEGLEQDFNSLDAQREACEAYIKSQMHEGWTLISKHYDDGGFSGGTIDRPAFQELLEDIKNDNIDIVVVYKVDRLTRSIMDFAKIIEIFDNHKASFVSITQHFNTTTSMGRLTLNILLSFAQFEREVTGERIRDKFEATRKKGLWIFGNPPYGYTKDNHHILHAEEPYASNIQEIYNLYLEYGSIDKIQPILKEKNICTKTGKYFSRGNLYNILSNKIYIGKIVHNDKIYEGQHIGIIDEKLFNKVQEQILTNSIIRKHSLNAKDGSLLAGLLYDDVGNRMSPSYSSHKGKKYRYYIVYKNKVENMGHISKIAAGEIETYIKTQLFKLITDEKIIQSYLNNESVQLQTEILNSLNTFPLDKLFIRNAINRIDLNPDEIKITYDMNYIIESLKAFVQNKQIPLISKNPLLVPHAYNAKISQVKQQQNKIIIPGKTNYNMKLINAIVQSFWFNDKCANGELNRKERTNGNNKRYKNLRFLPKDLIEDIITGRQDPELTIDKLLLLVK